jgi:hypothetical protein
LELHAVEDESEKMGEVRFNRRCSKGGIKYALYDQRVTMLGDERALLVNAIEVTSGDGAVPKRSRREEFFRVTVFLDELLGYDPEDLGPYFTNGVDTPVSWLVEGLVGRWVDRLIL